MELTSKSVPVRRRRFLQLALGSGAALAAGFVALSRQQGPQSEQATTRTAKALGAEVTLTVLGATSEHAHRAIDAALQELETVEQVMSLYRPQSQLCRLNRERCLLQPHPYLVTVLSEATSVSKLSAGAFDISVQPLWELLSTTHKAGRAPSDNELAAALKTVDWRGVAVSSQEIVFNDPVVSVTLNGIAQGFAADRVAAVFKEHGIEHALINAGEINSLGCKPNGEQWKVGIQHPRERDAYVVLAGLQNRALSTSGDYETTFAADFSKHHIVDPATGTSPLELASVSIAAPTAMQADALSTAAMVLGPQRTLEFIRQCPGVDALLVLKSGRVLKTAGFPEIS